MTENDGFNSPTQQDLEMIAKSRDSLLRHRLEQQNKAAAKKLNLKPGDKLCPICGETLEQGAARLRRSAQQEEAK